MAQAIHAGHLFSVNAHKTQAYKDWAEDRGFGTTITLSADERQIDRLVDSMPTDLSGWVVDPTYPATIPGDVLPLIDTEMLSDAPRFINDGKTVILYRKEKTCAYLFGDKSFIQPLTADLPMYS